MDLLQAHLLCLEVGYGGDYNKCVARPFNSERYEYQLPNRLADLLGLELLQL